MRTSVLAKLGSTALSSSIGDRRRGGLALLGAACLLSATAHGQTLPTGGSVVQGAATIATGPGSVTVNQTSARAVINWSDFSVAAGNSITFAQPNAEAATLNRVTSSATSQIAGHIASNGAVYLVNPNGIVITSTGTIDTAGGFVASTLDIADRDFMAGTTRFTGHGASAKVSNAGRISAGQSGYVALLGGSVSNSGTINVPLGRVGLGSGEQIALDINGGNFLQVAVPTSALGDGAALIEQSGSITAGGGLIQLKAATLKDAVRNVINMSGSITADSATADGGTIQLLAGDGGTLSVSGTLTARALGASGDGGSIETSGEKAALAGASVSTSAAHGLTGRWLIDPVDFTVAASGGDLTGAQLTTALAANNVTIFSSSGTRGSAGNINVNDTVSWSANTLTLDAYNNINVNAVMSATGSARFVGITGDTAQNGTSSNASAALLMGLDPTNGFFGRLDLAAGTGFRLNGVDYTVITTLGAQGSATGTDLQGMLKNLAGNYVLGASIDASATAGWNNAVGTGFVPIGDAYDIFTGSVLGLGHTVDSLTMNLSFTLPVGPLGFIGQTSASARIADIGLRQASVSGSPSGALLVGTNYGTISQSYVQGSVSGSVGGSADTTSTIGGLVSANGGTISTSFANVTVTGRAYVGGLVGINYSGATISQSFATGSVNQSVGIGQVGGLVGNNQGTIRQSYANAQLRYGDSAVDAGGLVGVNYNLGVISQSYALGSMQHSNSGGYSGTLAEGGLVGANYSSIDQSYSAESILGFNSVFRGGLVGLNNGSATTSFWDSQLWGASNTNAGVGLTTAQMQNFASYTTTYAGWDFNTVWAPPAQAGQAGQTQGYYPQLYALSPVEFLNPTSTRTYGSSNHSGLIGGGPGAYAFGILGDWQNGALFSSSATITSNVGSYGVTTLVSGNSITSANGVSYRLIASPSGTLTITPASIVVTALGGTSVYGSTPANPGLSAAGLVNGEDVSVLTGLSNSFGITNASNAGTYATNVIGTLTNGNYTITNLVGGSWLVNPASIGVTALGGTSTYGSSPTNPGLSATGLVNGQDVSVLTGLFNSFGITNATNAGSYSTSVGGTLTNGNYTVTNRVSGSWVVNPAPITVSALGGVSTYGSSPINPGLSATGLVNGQDVSVLTGLSNSYGIFNATNAGSYATNVVGTLTNGNYTITNRVSGNWVVNPASVTLFVIGGSSTYGSSPNNPGFFASGLVNGQNVSVLTGLSNSFGITNTTNAGIYSLTIAGTLTNSNYVVGTVYNGSWHVNPASVTVTALGGASTYGSSPSNPGLSASGLVNGQDVSVLTGLSNSFGITNTTNVGSYATNVVGTLTNGNYAITNRVSGSWLVNPASIVVTALGGTSTYGSSPANPGLSATGLVNGQDVSVLTGLSNSFGITNTTNAGSYATNVAGTLTNGNYTIANRVSGSWLVNPASIVVTALGGTSTYGSSPTNPGLSATGLVNGQDVSVLTGLSNSFGITSATNAGNYATNVTGTLTNGNYAITNRVSGSWLVNPASIVVTALGGTSTYGSSPANPGLSATGLVNGQDVSVLTGLSNSFGITNTTNAGSYATNVAGTLTNGNYTIANRVSGSWLVNPASIVVTALGGTSTYGSSPANPGLSATGLVNGEDVSVLTGLSNSFGITNATNAGSYATNVAGTLTNGNYAITNRVSGSWLVNPASIVVTALGGTSTYGSSPANPGLSATGLVNGQDVSVLTGLSNSFGITNATNAGSYATNVAGTLTNGNYTITNLVSGSWLVNPASISVTALGGSSIYGASPTNPGLSVTGLVNGQDISVLTGLSNSFGITNATNAGSYATNVAGTLTNGNYAITNRVSGSWLVNPAQLLLIYTANTASSVYGSPLAALSGSVNATGFVNGQTLGDVTSGTVGWSTGATASSNAGSYAITGGGLVANGNYLLTVQQAASNAGAYRITPASLVVTYTANPLSSIYGNTPTGLSGNVGVVGLVNRDTIAAALSGTASWTASASAATGVGHYAITGGGLTAATGNYAIIFNQATGNSVALTITPRPLTITADAQKRFYGVANPVLTYSLATGANTGLVNGDTLSGGLATTATANSPAGEYAITLGSLAASPNYLLTYFGANLTVSIAPVQLLNGFIPAPNGDTILWLGNPIPQQGGLQQGCQAGDVSAGYRSQGNVVLTSGQSGGGCAN